MWLRAEHGRDVLVNLDHIECIQLIPRSDGAMVVATAAGPEAEEYTLYVGGDAFQVFNSIAEQLMVEDER